LCGHVAQVIEGVPARLAFIALTMRLVCMKAPLVHESGTALRTAHALRPVQSAYHLKTLGVINQMLNIDHAPIVPTMALFVTSLKSVKSLCQVFWRNLLLTHGKAWI
jgi:hypothetical protein